MDGVYSDTEMMADTDEDGMLPEKNWGNHVQPKVSEEGKKYITKTTRVIEYVGGRNNRSVIFYSGSFMQICLFMESLVVSPHLTEIARDFGLSDQDRDLKLGGGLQLSLFLIALPFSLITGNLGDRFDRKKTILSFGILGALGNLFMFLAKNYEQFLLFRCVAGVSCGTSNVFMSIVSDLYSEHERVSVLGQYNASLGVGVGIGVLISVTAGDAFGWRVAFLFVGIIQGLSIVIFALMVPGEEEARPSTAKGRSEKLNTGAIVTAIFGRCRNILIFVQAVFAGIPIATIGVFLLDFLNVDAKAPSKLQALLIVTCFGIGLVLGQTMISKLIAWLRIPCFVDDAVTYYCISLWYTLPIIPLFMVWSCDFSLWMSAGMIVCGFFSGLNIVAVRTVLMNSNTSSVHSSIFSIFSIADALGRGPLIMVISWAISKVGRQIVLSYTSFSWAVPAVIFFFLFANEKLK